MSAEPDKNEHSLLSGMNNQEIDRAISATREQIEEQIKNDYPLIGARVPLSTLKGDFKDDSLFLEKVEDLTSIYTDIIKIRPDGNCFYTSFAFSLFEMLMSDPSELGKVKTLMKKTRDFLIETLSYPDITVDDFYDTVMELIGDVASMKTSDELLCRLSDPGIANYVVCWMRLVASAELQKQPDFYINFLPNVASVQDFCRREVEPLGVDIDHVVITALSTGLETAVRVACLERRPGKAQIIDFFGENAKINLMFRPGHYDILYVWEPTHYKYTCILISRR